MSKRLNIAFDLILVSGLATSCKRSAEVNTTGFILGPSDDIATFNDDNDGEQINADDVARSAILIATTLESKVLKFCSGSLIAKDDDKDTMQVLTNFHCFAKTNKQGKVSAKMIDEACVETKVYVGFTEDHFKDNDSYECMEGSLRGDHDGDLAVFTIKWDKNDKQVKPFKLWQEESTPKNRKAFIIHHPDIKDRYEDVDARNRLPVASITVKNCEAEGLFAYREWLLDPALPYSLKHTCDLTNGSSGSALIDALTHSILGVNWGGIEIKYRGQMNRYNAATRAEYIKAFLDGDTKEIREKINSKGKLGDEGNDQVVQGEVSQEEGHMKAGSCGTIGARINFLGPVNYLWLLGLLLPLVRGLARRLRCLISC